MDNCIIDFCVCVMELTYVIVQSIIESVTPNLGVTKEIMSRGPQVADMECQEPDGQSIAPKGPSFSFDAFYTSPTVAASTTLAWSQKEMGLSP
jgi:hypothetical protein